MHYEESIKNSNGIEWGEESFKSFQFFIDFYFRLWVWAWQDSHPHGTYIYILCIPYKIDQISEKSNMKITRDKSVEFNIISTLSPSKLWSGFALQSEAKAVRT